MNDFPGDIHYAHPHQAHHLKDWRTLCQILLHHAYAHASDIEIVTCARCLEQYAAHHVRLFKSKPLNPSRN